MDMKLENMVAWERKKALYLLTVADDLGMDVDGYGELAVNPNSGYTYLWLEDYPFTLYMPISCELTKNDVCVSWMNLENGEEIKIELENKTLDDLYEWIKKLENENQEEEEEEKEEEEE